MPYPSLSPLRRLEELLNTAARLRLVAHQVPLSAVPFPRPHARLQHLHRELDRIIADVAEGTAIITAVDALGGDDELARSIVSKARRDHARALEHIESVLHRIAGQPTPLSGRGRRFCGHGGLRGD